ncbi:MAG: hypothetical protein EP343_08425 [Deltaproteobacteria bacterium]|nr:MAG: hypothetical protein EP343_08425 [Deltaproteobacteria bacterium]
MENKPEAHFMNKDAPRYKERMRWIERSLAREDRQKFFQFCDLMLHWPSEYPLDEAMERAATLLSSWSPTECIPYNMELSHPCWPLVTNVGMATEEGSRMLIALLQGGKLPRLRSLFFVTGEIQPDAMNALAASSLTAQLEHLLFKYEGRPSPEAWKQLQELPWDAVRSLSFKSEKTQTVPVPNVDFPELTDLYISTKKLTTRYFKTIVQSPWFNSIVSLHCSTQEPPDAMFFASMKQWKLPNLCNFVWTGSGSNPEIVPALSDAFVPSLESLTITHAGLDLQALEALTEAPWFGQLRTLKVTSNPLGKGAGALLAERATHLEHLDLMYCNLGATGAKDLAKGQFSHLQSLDLSDNMIRSTGLRAFTKTQTFPALREFHSDVFEANITDKALEDFAESHLPQLRLFNSGEIFLTPCNLALLHSSTFHPDFSFSYQTFTVNQQLSESDWKKLFESPRLANFTTIRFENVEWSRAQWKDFLQSTARPQNFTFKGGLLEKMEGELWDKILNSEIMSEIQRFNLTAKAPGDRILRALAHSPTIRLEHLSLDHCSVTDEGFRWLTSSPVFVGLRSFSFRHHKLTEEGVALFIKETEFPLLYSVSFSHGSLSAKAKKALRAWAGPSMHLHLKYNRERKPRTISLRAQRAHTLTQLSNVSTWKWNTTFVLTGQFTKPQRECRAAIRQEGGRVQKSLSTSSDILVVGLSPSLSMLQQAQQLGCSWVPFSLLAKELQWELPEAYPWNEKLHFASGVEMSLQALEEGLPYLEKEEAWRWLRTIPLDGGEEVPTQSWSPLMQQALRTWPVEIQKQAEAWMRGQGL